MSELRFYGASDDLVEVEGVVREEYNVPASGSLGFRVWQDDGAGTIEGCRVKVRYTDQGVWAVEVSHLEEGFALPWSATIEHEHPYSVALVLRGVPEDVHIESNDE